MADKELRSRVLGALETRRNKHEKIREYWIDGNKGKYHSAIREADAKIEEIDELSKIITSIFNNGG